MRNSSETFCLTLDHEGMVVSDYGSDAWVYVMLDAGFQQMIVDRRDFHISIDRL